MNITIVRYETIGSTNTEAADHARRGADEGLCIIAREQTSGRGRYGREWASAKDAGLYMSLVLRPGLDRSSQPLITLMAGIAVHDAIADLGMSPDIKWVNDILIADKKICGILAEAIETQKGTAVILGIGVNLTSANFPVEFAAAATSIESETGQLVPAGVLAESITRNIQQFYEILQGANGAANIVEAWSKRSSYCVGKPVRVTISGNTLEGITDGLEENGALRLKRPDGSIDMIQAGDVERLRAKS